MNNSRSDYRICPYCGAALDVGEKCDCTQERQTAGQRRRTQGGFFAAKAIKPHAQTAKTLKKAKNGTD